MGINIQTMVVNKEYVLLCFLVTSVWFNTNTHVNQTPRFCKETLNANIVATVKAVTNAT
jgi:hypothetical protein